MSARSGFSVSSRVRLVYYSTGGEGGKEDPEPRERERGMEERDRERDSKREGRRGARISGAEGQSMGPGEEESRRHAEGGLGSK